MTYEELIAEALLCLNQEPRFSYHGGAFEDSYDLCSAMDRSLKQPTAERFTHDDMDAALCIWEFSLMNQARNQDHVFDWLRGGEGAASARDMCVKLAKDCDRSYQVANELGYDRCFDWEFIPNWVLMAMDITESKDLTPEWVDFIGRKIYYEFRLENERLPG